MAKIENSLIKLELSQREMFLIIHAVKYMSDNELYDYSEDDRDAAELLKELTGNG
jgi:hypothetical protein